MILAFLINQISNSRIYCTSSGMGLPGALSVSDNEPKFGRSASFEEVAEHGRVAPPPSSFNDVLSLIYTRKSTTLGVFLNLCPLS